MGNVFRKKKKINSAVTKNGDAGKYNADAASSIATVDATSSSESTVVTVFPQKQGKFWKLRGNSGDTPADSASNSVVTPSTLPTPVVTPSTPPTELPGTTAQKPVFEDTVAVLSDDSAGGDQEPPKTALKKRNEQLKADLLRTLSELSLISPATTIDTVPLTSGSKNGDKLEKLPVKSSDKSKKLPLESNEKDGNKLQEVNNKTEDKSQNVPPEIVEKSGNVLKNAPLKNDEKPEKVPVKAKSKSGNKANDVPPKPSNKSANKADGIPPNPSSKSGNKSNEVPTKPSSKSGNKLEIVPPKTEKKLFGSSDKLSFEDKDKIVENPEKTLPPQNGNKKPLGKTTPDIKKFPGKSGKSTLKSGKSTPISARSSSLKPKVKSKAPSAPPSSKTGKSKSGFPTKQKSNFALSGKSSLKSGKSKSRSRPSVAFENPGAQNTPKPKKSNVKTAKSINPQTSKPAKSFKHSKSKSAKFVKSKKSKSAKSVKSKEAKSSKSVKPKKSKTVEPIESGNSKSTKSFTTKKSKTVEPKKHKKSRRTKSATSKKSQGRAASKRNRKKTKSKWAKAKTTQSDTTFMTSESELEQGSSDSEKSENMKSTFGSYGGIDDRQTINMLHPLIHLRARFENKPRCGKCCRRRAKSEGHENDCCCFYVR